MEEVPQEEVRAVRPTSLLMEELKAVEREVEEGIAFRGDSDAHIVKGLVTLLLSATAGRSPDELCALDLTALFKELGLESHLSVSRRNGFFSMVEKMKSYAKARSTL